MMGTEDSFAHQLSPEEFRRLGHLVIDWIADYRQNAESQPVTVDVEPGALLAQLPQDPPEQPEGFEALLKDLDTLIVPHLASWQHPNFFAYFPSNGDLSAVLGDLLSTGLGVLGLTWQSAPALTELEDRTTDWLRRMSGLDASWQGVIQDTASTGTLVALVAARERTSNHGAVRSGMQHGEQPLVVYTSSEAHSSVEKAALLCGFGSEHVRRVAVDGERRCDPEALRSAIEADLAAGLRPCAIIATTGTTATTACDPIEPMAAVAAAHGLWLHVDAAMAGSAMILPEQRHLWQGIDQADSVVVNPHKWLGASFDCSVLYVRDDEHLVRVMRTDPSYLRTDFDDRVKTYRDWGVALGRRFRALKLWALIRTHGTQRLQARLRRDIDNARWLEEQLAAAPDWHIVAPRTLQTLCVRHEPPGLEAPAIDEHTTKWLARIHKSGKAWLTPAQIDGRWMARISIGSLGTERRHVEGLWRALQRAVAEDS
ncbi:MAG: aspartate aminotransferase family protein [Planctomycetota bacterium]